MTQMAAVALAVTVAIVGEVSWPVAAQAQSYLCIAESSAGIKFDKSSKSWHPSADKSTTKYLITRPQPDFPLPKVSWVVRAFGEDNVISWCDEDFNKVGSLYCSGFGHEIKMNRNSNRFLLAYLDGYWLDKGDGARDFRGQVEGDNEPHLKIGRCSKI